MAEVEFDDNKKAGAWRFVPMFVFAIVMVGGFVATLLSLQKAPADTWDGLARPKSLADGESTRKFTQALNKHFLLSKPFAQIERAVFWNLAGDAGNSVRPGCPGWFFLNDEITVYPDRLKNAQARAEIVAKVKQQLASKNIKLVVAVVPDKARIESAQLCQLHRSALLSTRLDTWLHELRQRDIAVIDLSAQLAQIGGPRYYRTDTHWNEAGANFSAKSIADWLILKGWLAAPAQLADFNQFPVKVKERPGDLLRVANLEGLPAAWRPDYEIAQETKVPAVEVSSDDLFGDAGVPTLAVIGTSFSRTSNFIPFLAQHLGVPVANLAKDGGDFEGAAIAYLDSPQFSQTPPKVLLWEIPERMLEKPLSKAELNWQKKLQVK